MSYREVAHDSNDDYQDPNYDAGDYVVAFKNIYSTHAQNQDALWHIGWNDNDSALCGAAKLPGAGKAILLHKDAPMCTQCKRELDCRNSIFVQTYEAVGCDESGEECEFGPDMVQPDGSHRWVCGRCGYVVTSSKEGYQRIMDVEKPIIAKALRKRQEATT